LERRRFTLTTAVTIVTIVIMAVHGIDVDGVPPVVIGVPRLMDDHDGAGGQ
jgi:hypothetical protein